MKHKISLSLIAISLLASSVSAFDLEYRLDNIDAEIKKMNTANAEFNSTKERYLADMDELDQTVAKLETEAKLAAKVRWGVAFSTQMDNFKTQTVGGNAMGVVAPTLTNPYGIGNVPSKTFDNQGVMRTRAEFNAFSQVTNDMTFDATLSVYKNWGDSTRNGWNTVDSVEGRRPGSSQVYLTRGYVDWKLPEFFKEAPMTLTLGRQPSQGGISYEFSNDTQRKGTYSALAFDGSVDGAVLTTSLQKMSGYAGHNIRVAYGKSYQNDRASQNEYSFTGVDTEKVKDSNVLGLFMDIDVPTVKDGLAQVSYVVAKDLYASVDGDQTAENIGDIALITGMVSLPNFRDSHYDLFAHYSMSTATPNGKAVYTGNPMYPPFSLLGNKVGDTEKKNGTAMWLGGRYTMDNGYKLGLEYNKGSENWMSFTSGSESLFNKLAIRGDATEAYLLIPINRFANIKLGALVMNYKYSGSGQHFGTPTPVSAANSMKLPEGALTPEKVTNYYASFNLRF